MIDSKALHRSLTLVQALYERTRDGQIEWRESERRTGFETELGDYVLRIRERQDQDYPDEPDYFLDVRRKKRQTNPVGTEIRSDQTIETISNISLRPVMDRLTDDGLSPRTALERIYTMARRKVYGVDEALDVILESLKAK